MCFGGGSKKAAPPAAAPDAPLPAPDDPEIGATRRKENEENFGDRDAPSYRVTRGGKPNVAPGGPIQM